jgi:hypothetical protein
MDPSNVDNSSPCVSEGKDEVEYNLGRRPPIHLPLFGMAQPGHHPVAQP